MPITGAPPGAPIVHAGQHENGGADEIDVEGLSGQLADPQYVKPHAASHEDGGADEIDVEGLSGQLADPQFVKPHAASHMDGAPDELDAADLAGADGAAGEVLTSDGAAASWVAPAAAAPSAWGSYVGNRVDNRRILTGFLCHMAIILCLRDREASTWTVLNVLGEKGLRCWEANLPVGWTKPYLHAADGFVLGDQRGEANETGWSYRYMAFG